MEVKKKGKRTDRYIFIIGPNSSLRVSNFNSITKSHLLAQFRLLFKNILERY